MDDPTMVATKKALPDSRAREARGEIRTPFGTATPVFCASCGKDAGFTFASTEFMFYLCDECDVYGSGLDLPVVDPEEIEAFTKRGG